MAEANSKPKNFRRVFTHLKHFPITQKAYRRLERE
jgi:hypothetical protein